MSILGNNLADTIQSDRREHAARERVARSVRAERHQPETTTGRARRPLAQRVWLSMPNWALSACR
jgi:hypothetical protein